MPGAPRRQVSLCKSIATQLLDAGAPLRKVSSFLGHSDPKITVTKRRNDSFLRNELFLHFQGG
jgi:integrase